MGRLSDPNVSEAEHASKVTMRMPTLLPFGEGRVGGSNRLSGAIVGWEYIIIVSSENARRASRLRLRMCILIYNDSSYAAEVHYFRRQG